MANNVPRLRESFDKNIIPALMSKMGYKNIMEVPHIHKIVVSIGVGKATQNQKLIDAALNDLRLITGQQPIISKAKKSEAGFKLRKGMPIGVTVTLRKTKMYEFLDRLISLSIPRVKDFEGLSDTAFDGRGNYSIGIREQLVFPEIDYDKVDEILGIGITIVTSAKTDEEAKELLAQFGMPFEKREVS